MSVNGVIQDVQDALRNTLAATHAWQHWQSNAWTLEEAKERIYHDALPPPADGAETHSLDELNSLRPFALIYTMTEGGFEIAKRAAGVFVSGGILGVCIEQTIPTDILDDPAEIDRAMRHDLGRLLKTGDAAEPGLQELDQQAGMLQIKRITVRGPVRADVADIEEYGESQRVWLEIEWGLT